MDLPWNRLGPLIRIPYLPTLGAIHPSAVGPTVWAEVLGVAGTGRWLPHDKDARWGGAKPESVNPQPRRPGSSCASSPTPRPLSLHPLPGR